MRVINRLIIMEVITIKTDHNQECKTELLRRCFDILCEKGPKNTSLEMMPDDGEAIKEPLSYFI
jgi:hypothetical protein